jgi:H+/gluconate symporter-like permease
MALVYVGLLTSLVVFVFLTYRKISPLIVAPLVTLILAGIVGMNFQETLLDGYMGLAANYVKLFFFVFLTGAVFAAIMHRTGAAASIAEGIVRVIGKDRVVLGVVLPTALLTYGGISLFIIFFVMYPMALVMHKEANVTKKLIPGEIALGAFTFTMTTPGSPQVQNIIPMQFLGTPATAGFIPGWIAGLIIAVVGIVYLNWRKNVYLKKGMTFEAQDELEETTKDLPKFLTSILPSILIIVLLNVFQIHIVWSMSAGIALAIVLLWKRVDSVRDWIALLNNGSLNSTAVILNTAAIVGYAGAVRLLPQFPQIIDSIRGMNVSAYYFPAISTSLVSGIAASSSGGLSVAFGALTETFQSLGIPLEAVHRISSMAAGTIDSLPHCPAIINLLAVTKLTHNDSYLDIAVTTIVIPLTVVFTVLVPLFIAMG